MVRLGERPRWKRILYLEFMAVDMKKTIMMEGYVVLLLGLTSPIWCWIFLPFGVRFARDWLRHHIEMKRRAPYGGIDIAEYNTARPVWSWVRRMKTLDRPSSSNMLQAESPLSRLPEEIRREIFLHLVRPAEELTICSLKKERRLIALPTYVWDGAYDDGTGRRQGWEKLLHFLNNSVGDEQSNRAYTCNDMLALAKTNRGLSVSALHSKPARNVTDSCSVPGIERSYRCCTARTYLTSIHFAMRHTMDRSSISSPSHTLSRPLAWTTFAIFGCTSASISTTYRRGEHTSFTVTARTDGGECARR